MPKQTDKIAEQLKDCQALRQTYINKANETQVKLARVEEQIKKLRGN